MHQVAKVATLAIVLAFGVRPVYAQVNQTTPQMAAINAVIGFRLAFESDSTAFDGCSVSRATGLTPQQVADGLLPGFRDWFVSTAVPCGATQANRQQDKRVLVDSVVVSGSTARVFVSVRRGEMSHMEEYLLTNPTPGVTWGVDRAILSHASREYFSRPGTGPGFRP